MKTAPGFGQTKLVIWAQFEDHLGNKLADDNAYHAYVYDVLFPTDPYEIG